MRKNLVCLVAIILAAGFASCSSDPEGPITAIFVEDGTYGAEAGETVRFVEAIAGTMFTVPLGIGSSSLLDIGELRGVRYEAILFYFDFTPSPGNEGKTVASAILDLPLYVAPAGSDDGGTYEAINLNFTLNELEEAFEETDTITSVPPYDVQPIPDSLGGTDRILNEFKVEFSIDTGIMQGWIDQTTPNNGFAMIWMRNPDSLYLFEIKARELAQDPTVIRVKYSDQTGDTFAVTKDYAVATFNEQGLNAIGGLARRIYFDFSLAGIPDNAMINTANLVLSVNGSNGFGATTGQLLLGLSSEFYYYLYTPDRSDPDDPGFLQGTGVDRGYFNPAADQTRRMPLTLFVKDILTGVRQNNGLIIQSDLEGVRIQRTDYFTSAADSALRPYVEVIYTLPADFEE
jgi:hypothetical protein